MKKKRIVENKKKKSKNKISMEVSTDETCQDFTETYKSIFWKYQKKSDLLIYACQDLVSTD